MKKIGLLREIKELKTQLSYSKNIGFFLGAGTSCALGLPNIGTLTGSVEAALNKSEKENFLKIKTDLKAIFPDKNINIEDVLNQIRRVREITGGKKDRGYIGIDGESASDLDGSICKQIYSIISQGELSANLETTKKFLAWFNMQNKNSSKEIFTTNYDLIFEKALEENRIPYFDGFVGAYEPFFWQESIDKFVSSNDFSGNWIRLWKIHGSLGWFWRKNNKADSYRVVRLGRVQEIEDQTNELVIYPSKEKYDSSRKQPFIAYFDRLKNYLLSGELLFVFSGYSFSDQHINDVLFNCLRQNNRLFALVFFYSDLEVEALFKIGASYLNMAVFGPKKAIINGALCEWSFDAQEVGAEEGFDTYWDDGKKSLKLGDFNSLVDFFIASAGLKEQIGAVIDGN